MLAGSWRAGTAMTSTRSLAGAATTRSSHATTWSWGQSNDEHGRDGGHGDDGERGRGSVHGAGGQGCGREVGAARSGAAFGAPAGLGGRVARAGGAGAGVRSERARSRTREVRGGRGATGEAPGARRW